MYSPTFTSLQSPFPTKSLLSHSLELSIPKEVPLDPKKTLEVSSQSLSHNIKPSCLISNPTNKRLNQKEDRKAGYKGISLPYFILPPFSSHLLEGDLFLYDRPVLNEDGEIRGLLSNYNSCKRILSVAFDLQTRMASARVETNENLAFTPFEMMIKRLDSQGEANAHKLAMKVRKMADFITRKKEKGVVEMKLQRGDPVYRDYQLKVKDFLHRFIEESIISFKFRFSKTSNELEAQEIGFNETIIERMGFLEFGDFGKSILKEGFPDSVLIEENYHNWYSRMLTNSFLRLIDPKIAKESMEVYFSSLYKNFIRKIDHFIK